MPALRTSSCPIGGLHGKMLSMDGRPLRPAVFLDRDGTLIEEKHYLSRPEQVRLLPGAADAVRSLRQAGWACVVVSNQSGIGRGFFTEDDLRLVHEELHRQLAAAGTKLDGLYYCPLAPNATSAMEIEYSERKPGPGMLLRAARELHLDLTNSWMVGDSIVDVLAGRNAGCSGSILVRSGHEIDKSEPHLTERDVILDDLAAAARWILRTPPLAKIA